jgi:hypothetical protein
MSKRLQLRFALLVVRMLALILHHGYLGAYEEISLELSSVTRSLTEELQAAA